MILYIINWYLKFSVLIHLEPSDEDILITEKLREAGDLINLRVLDHVIFSEEKYQIIIF